jgi:hypothetical protein
MPDGTKVNFPDTMSREQIKGMIATKFPEVAQEEVVPTGEPLSDFMRPMDKETSAIDAAAQGLGQGVTFGFGDELQSMVAGAVGATSPELTYSEAYNQAKEMFRQRREQAKEQQPLTYYGSELAGGVATGGVAAKRIGGKALAKQFAKNPIRTSGATGAISGGVYGTGASEGTIPERLAQGGEAAAVGLGLGTAGGYIAPKITAGAKRLFRGKQPNIPTASSLDDLVETRTAQEIAPKASFGAEEAAQDKIIKALKKDYPDNWQDVFQQWKTSGKPLAEIGGSQTTSLAKGAAQYPSGQQVASRYFTEQIEDMPERIKSAISQNVSSVDNYYTNADDIVRAGQKKAAPLYKKAFQIGAIDNDEINAMLDIPELKKAIGEGVKLERIDAAAQGLRFNPAKYNIDEAGNLMGRAPTMELLDSGKRGLDTLIDAETDALTGKVTQYGRSLVNLRKAFVNKLDEVNPFYKQARREAGDYLSVKSAMDDGKSFMRMDSELIEKKLRTMTEKEKQAYKIGVGKYLRDVIDSPTGSTMNPYNKVFRGIEQKKKLSKILNPTEYINFEKAIKAEDNLWKMRNEVLGGSPTASKQIAAQQIAAGGADLAGALATGDVTGVSAGLVRGFIRKTFDGLSDKSADAVARLLFEKDPVKKLRLLESAVGAKNISTPEKQLIKQSYFALNDAIKAQQQSAVASGVAAGQITQDTE